MTGIARLTDVTRRFVARAETIVAVSGVSLAVEAGRSVAIVGPSGSGKSTLLQLLAGWEVADEGTIALAPEVTERVGWSGMAFVPQELGLLAELTARENVELPLRLARRAGDVTELLERLDIDQLGDRLPGELSLGEQQRFAVARAVVAEPLLLVADEPTAHQDEQRADLVMAALATITAAGGAVVVATHDLRLLDRLDDVVHLLDGRIVAPT